MTKEKRKQIKKSIPQLTVKGKLKSKNYSKSNGYSVKRKSWLR
jgi:hypothetical protein